MCLSGRLVNLPGEMLTGIILALYIPVQNRCWMILPLSTGVYYIDYTPLNKMPLILHIFDIFITKSILALSCKFKGS